MAGHSDTPLARKLGIKGRLRGPGDWSTQRIPGSAGACSGIDRVHEHSECADQSGARVCDGTRCARPVACDAAQETFAGGGRLVSWPKKSSKLPTDIADDTIRKFALPLGFVDVKVCAVTEVWSGLKLVDVKELRARS